MKGRGDDASEVRDVASRGKSRDTKSIFISMKGKKKKEGGRMNDMSHQDVLSDWGRVDLCDQMRHCKVGNVSFLPQEEETRKKEGGKRKGREGQLLTPHSRQTRKGVSEKQYSRKRTTVGYPRRGRAGGGKGRDNSASKRIVA